MAFWAPQLAQNWTRAKHLQCNRGDNAATNPQNQTLAIRAIDQNEASTPSLYLLQLNKNIQKQFKDWIED